MVTGSNPVSGATFLNTPKTPISTTLNQDLTCGSTNYDTTSKNNDTSPLRLYKVDRTFYYRRRIKQKLFRISLKTKNIKIALKRKKILDLIDGEEMFQIDTGDFKLMFEYDTEEELRFALEQAQEIQIQAQLQRFKEVKQHIESSDSIEQEVLSFENLRDIFILKQKRDGLTAESISEYIPTFKKLIAYFEEKNVNQLVLEDYEKFKEHLTAKAGRGGKPLAKKTVNKHLIYLKNFLKAIDLDEVASKISLYRKSVVRKEAPKKENYTAQEIKNILNYEHNDPILQALIKIALYTGMRQGELRMIGQEDIKQDEKSGILYFDITQAKSEAGVRTVPVHKDIEELVLSLSFPLYPDLVDNKNAFGKKVRYALYKAVNEKHKDFHTLRANFIDSIIENNFSSTNPFALNVIQEIVGHSIEEKDKLTLHTYKKYFRITNKKALMDNVEF